MASIFRHSMVRKLTIAVVVKLLVLLALWWLFFRESGHHQLTTEQVGRAFFQSPLNPSQE